MGRLHAPGRAALAALTVAAAACGGTVPAPASAPSTPAQGNPLGPSYVLMPLPGEDESRPNPCAEHLEAPRRTGLDNHFHYAEELAGTESAGAILGSFGFSADASQATHFVYDLHTTRRLAVSDTTAYDACCKEMGSCGYGFVSSLIGGEGAYAAAEEMSGAARGGVPLVASASGGVQLRTLQKKSVKGWIAAVITVTDPGQGLPLGPLATESVARVSAEVLDDDLRAMLELERITTEPLPNASDEDHWTFIAGRKEILTEPEFARRYKAVTGSSELDHLDTRRNLGGVITSGVFFTGATVCTVGTAVAAGDEAPGWYVGTALCGVVALSTGLGFVFGILGPDGEPLDHDMSESEARRYTTRYNQQVMKRFLREQHGAPRSSRGVDDRGPLRLASPAPADATLELRLGAAGASLDGTF
jgi:hypothetical protein